MVRPAAQWPSETARRSRAVCRISIYPLKRSSYQWGMVTSYFGAGMTPGKADREHWFAPLKASWFTLLVLASLAVVISTRTVCVQAASSKPNIIHIVADDLGWKDVGFNGCTDIKTSNIDRLAATGARLEQFYTQPMCTPTRAALMTGRYPFRYGLQTLVIPSVSTYGLTTNEWLMPQALREAGYDTAIIGKWHLGHADRKYWPKQRGFDYQYGAMIGELDYFTHEEHEVLDGYRNNQPIKEEGTPRPSSAPRRRNSSTTTTPPGRFIFISRSTRRTRPTRRRRPTSTGTGTLRIRRVGPMREWLAASTTKSAALSPRWITGECATTRSSSFTATMAEHAARCSPASWPICPR